VLDILMGPAWLLAAAEGAASGSSSGGAAGQADSQDDSECPFALIYMDLNMPVMNGFQVSLLSKRAVFVQALTAAAFFLGFAIVCCSAVFPVALLVACLSAWSAKLSCATMLLLIALFLGGPRPRRRFCSGTRACRLSRSRHRRRFDPHSPSLCVRSRSFQHSMLFCAFVAFVHCAIVPSLSSLLRSRLASLVSLRRVL
jgi:hypothetical protein